MLHDLSEILKEVSTKPLEAWHAYACDNGTQNLDRLSFLMDSRYEVQINRIRHSNGKHCHGCNLMSVILLNGYGWWLQQYGSSKPIYLFAAENSVITMQPEDTHWIPEMQVPSVSLCVFDKQSDWHEHYCKYNPLSESESRALLYSAQFRIKSFEKNFCPDLLTVEKHD